MRKSATAVQFAELKMLAEKLDRRVVYGLRNYGLYAGAAIIVQFPRTKSCIVMRVLAELGLIDEYEFVVQPRLAGHRPTLFAGLSNHLDLRLVSRLEFGSGRQRCGMSRQGSHWAC